MTRYGDYEGGEGKDSTHSGRSWLLGGFLALIAPFALSAAILTIGELAEWRLPLNGYGALAIVLAVGAVGVDRLPIPPLARIAIATLYAPLAVLAHIVFVLAFECWAFGACI
ncbi:hypothetical protein [Aurantiacibacter spongiae]|uniref:Uncharacterized protein n=1 Tax=Aurantiacibacter spongiae TaxID=2488860 RepID=A0A3N5DLY0_9SPHN|nr:hypothetical protein [Aurantiacibacter spongiae]RPF71825.1 hypothetical protein EG799_09490 [Aurantiacibacter spongiae]